MLTKGDDYPIHQTSLPVAYSGTDRNFYDRYFFNGYSPDGKLFFAAALGVYPNINIMDASFCVIIDGVQHNIHASRVLHMERMDISVGPITITIVEPLQKLQVSVQDNDYDIRAELLFQGRIKPIEEPRFIFRQGPRTHMDYTRLTQNGTWSGWIEVKGSRVEISDHQFWGTRDRSWGVRPIGIQDPQPVVPEKPVQFYWLWAPLNFDDCVTFYAENANADGSAWVRGASYLELENGEQQDASSEKALLSYKSGTRHAKSATLTMNFEKKGDVQIVLEPQFNFYMQGLGYLNFEWGHGHYKGESAIGYDSFTLEDVNEADLSFWHIQAFCKARMTGPKIGEKEGVGILEQLIIGPHNPSGFKDFMDTAP